MLRICKKISMQKLSLLPLILVTGIGIIWASTLIFPNTTEFPRSPGWAGTISGALALFGADGIATNTEKLAGKYASGYLQNRDCSTELINKIWVGVDADGWAICGTRGVLIGYLTEGSSISVTRWSTSSIASIGDPLYAWDIVSTTAVGTGTIRFAADESILRLDMSTIVDLSVGQLSGQSVAQAILEDGRLWGRILTSTGVNLGWWGLVAGVRWTSVSIERPGTTWPYMISVIDSVIPLKAATLSPIGGTTILWTSPTILTAGSQLSVYPTTPTNSASSLTSYVSPVSPTTTKTTLLDGSAWIRDNTRADIDYLYTNSGVTPRILAEYNATISPTTPPAILDALCPESAGATVKKVYWISLIGTSYDTCQDATLLAFADYMGSTTSDMATLRVASPMISSGSTILAEGIGTITSGGYNITTTGQYISYSTWAFDHIGWLAGKTITIELESVPTLAGVLLDMGTTCKVSSKLVLGQFSSYTRIGTCTLSTTSSSNTIISILLPSSITQFYIGNQMNWTLPIWATIRSISIK
jgi:hypothetical protein